MSHSQHPLTQLEFSTTIAKRAQYEAFEFAVEPEGVHVRNTSYADPENHEYLVRVTDGVPVQCTCPADAHLEGACKHRVAVAIRDPIVAAATRQVAADGGTIAVDGEAIVDDEDEECAECLEDFPCWECVRTGKEGIPG